MADLTPQQFAERWAKSTLSERSGSQQHFIDLCRMLGQPTPAEVDSEGTFYTFEKNVRKSGGTPEEAAGGKGFADVWRKGRFAWEYKGKHRDLAAAYRQLQLYREDLENPPLLVVSDMDRYEIHTNFTGTVKRVYSFTNAEIPKPENLEILRALFEDPDALRPGRTSESVTEEVAAKFAQIADGLRSRGEDPQEAARFLNKLLFCLFAEDVGLLPEKLFTKLAERTRRDPDRFYRYATELFGAMAEGGDFLLEDIPYFDGGLFVGEEAVRLEPREISILFEAAKLDWGSVEPAIFGTLFERSLDPSRRSQLGAHYTSREDILTIVEPVLMAPLRREWDTVQEEVEALREKLPGATGTRVRNNLLRQMEAKIRGFAEKIRRVRVLDPACGSGNFLYVSLKQLLDLEKEVSTFAGKVGLTPFFPEVSPEQLHGIELSPYAHELAQVSIWIGYLQWMVDNGFGTRQEPILGPMTNIVEMDAILTHDEDGNLVEPEWPEADVIVGNPPFLGGNKIRAELGDEYIGDLFELYKERVPAFADFVCYWFEKAREQIAGGKASRVGLLATNSIRGGANRRVLERIKQTGDIFFAESDRPWILEGAAVRVSMVGFDGGVDVHRVLDGVPVEKINTALTESLDLSGARVLKENLLIQFEGTKKGAAFDIPYQVAQWMLSAPPNPNGRPNSDVVRPWVNGLDITRRPRNMWVIDFGVDASLEEAALYEAPFEYVRTHVEPKYGETRKHWWRHERPRVEMRRALQGLPRYLATPRVAKHRLFVWLDGRTLPDSQVIAFARDDDYFFGVLQSRVHESWALRMGTWMGVGNDLRYTPTTCFETFPLPWPPGEEPQDDLLVAEIAEAARRLDDLRRNWLNPKGTTEAELKKRTLTNLYNERPTWLDNLHAALDRAVFSAYGWPEEIGGEEILQRLLDLNLARSE
jgi:type II restriction/modification system DNA methylase subunit YeeA